MLIAVPQATANVIRLKHAQLEGTPASQALRYTSYTSVSQNPYSLRKLLLSLSSSSSSSSKQQAGQISIVNDESVQTLTSDVKVAAAKKRPSSEMAAM